MKSLLVQHQKPAGPEQRKRYVRDEERGSFFFFAMTTQFTLLANIKRIFGKKNVNKINFGVIFFEK